MDWSYLNFPDGSLSFQTFLDSQYDSDISKFIFDCPDITVLLRFWSMSLSFLSIERYSKILVFLSNHLELDPACLVSDYLLNDLESSYFDIFPDNPLGLEKLDN